MRVECKCGAKAVVRKSKQKGSCSSLLYSSCNDPECGHSFASTLDFKHSLSKSEFPIPCSTNGSRIYCGCGARAVIQKTNKLSKNVADIYLTCSVCEHRFVMVRAFSYTLISSATSSSSSELVNAIINSMPPLVRRSLCEQLTLFLKE